MKNLLVLACGLLCLLPRLSMAEPNGIKVSNLQTKIIYRSSSHTTYSMKADVENDGNNGDISVRLIAKNKEGFQISNTILIGYLEAGEKKTLTGTSLARPETAAEIDTWEVDRTTRFTK